MRLGWIGLDCWSSIGKVSKEVCTVGRGAIVFEDFFEGAGGKEGSEEGREVFYGCMLG